MIPKKKTVAPQKATSKAQPRRMKVNTAKRQQSKDLLRARESLLRTIAENYPNSFISIIEKDLTVGYTAGQEFKKLNLDPNQFVGLTLEQVFGEHAPLVRENYLKTFGGVETQFELFINNQHQFYRTVPLRDQAGRITRILAVVENITERKRAEEMLRISEERYRNFIAQSFEAISRTEFDHPIDITLPVEEQIDRIYENAFMAECNQAMADMYHVPSPEAFIGMRLINAHGGKDDPINRKTFRKLIENGYKSINDETKEYAVDGKLIWFLSNTIGIVENGYLVRLWGTAIDITEQKLTKDALEERIRFTNKLLDATALSTWISDAHGTAIQANPACYQFFGATEAEVIGKYNVFQDNIAEQQGAMPLIRRAYETGEPVTFFLDYDFGVVSHLKVQNATHKFIKVMLTPILDTHGKVSHVVSQSIDLTEIKRMEEKLRESEERLKLAVSGSHTGVWDRNFFTGQLNWSVECKAMFGLPPETEMNDERFMNALHPDDRRPTDIAIREAQAKRTDFNAEYRVIWPDGTLHWIAALGRWYYDKAGQAMRMAGVTLDITERKRMEEDLREGKERYKSLYNNTPIMMHSIDPQGRLLSVSDYWLQSMGYTRGEVLGRPSTDFLTEDSRRYARETVLPQFLKTGQCNDISYQFVRKNGEVMDVLLSAISEKDAEGRIIRSLAVIIDITERKQAKDKLRASEERFRQLITSAPDAVFVVDQEGKITFANIEATNLLGYARDEFIGMDVEKLIPQKIRESHIIDRTRYMSDPRTRLMGSQLNLIAVHKNGSEIPVDIKLGPVQMEAGIQVVAFMRDITERKQVEARLRESEALYDNLVNQLPQNLYRIDLDGKVLFVNKTLQQNLGTSLENIIGKIAYDLYPEDRADKYREEDALVIAGGKPLTFIDENKSPINGQVSYTEGTKIPIFDNDGKVCGIQGIFFDITERKRAEEQLRESRETLSLFINHSPIYAFIKEVTSTQSRVIYASENYVDMIGIPGSEMAGKTMEELFPAEFAAKITADDWAVASSNAILNLEEELNGRQYITIKFPLSQKGRANLLAGYTIDITERKRAEEALRDSETKFRAMFENSLDAIGVSKAGVHLFVNSAYLNLFGYSDEQEMAGKPILDLIAPDYREKILEYVRVRGRGEPAPANYETHGLRKDGTEFLMDAHISTYKLHNEIFTVAHLRDITESRQAEELIQMRLRLFEYANNHSIEELLQKALDEVGLFTKSPIGFFHFIESDQKTLSLQAWSTRTLTEFCQAEGKGMHYDIDQAGVWVDSVHQRKPVIHNDYASLPHRKGLPHDHAEVKRELVVPIIRKGNVVSIMGIGNKPLNYNEKDVEFASYVADIVWTIVERKQDADALQQANETLHTQLAEINALKETLQEQVIRDPLTNLHNRRYLDETLEHEVARARRENYPIGIMLIDIDHFKGFNDVYGHSAGDKVLKSLSRLLVDSIRQGDIACRYGGEEFLIVMIGAYEADAERRAEGICRDFSKLRIRSDAQELSATVSIGVAFYPKHGTEIQQVIGTADAAMYQAKQAGRNRTQVWQEK